MSSKRNNVYRLADHRHARIDTGLAKPGGMAVSTPDMQARRQRQPKAPTPRRGLVWWLAASAVALVMAGATALMGTPHDH